MASPLPFDTLVWLKQPDYPWWPGVVLDPRAVDMTLPDGCDTCVLCLPSASSSVAFAHSSNAAELARFDPSLDAARLAAGKAVPDCAAAIAEALAMHAPPRPARERRGAKRPRPPSPPPESPEHSEHTEHTESDAALRLAADALDRLAGARAVDEAAVLDALSPLARLRVPLAQLRRTRIGVAVGRFGAPRFPPRVVALASAIGRFWFAQLPDATRTALAARSQVDAASNETAAGSEGGDGLGALGVQLEACFTDAEVAATMDDPAAVAHALEADVLARNTEDVHRAVLEAMRSAGNGDLRAALLGGRLTAAEFVAQAADPEGMRRRLRGEETAEPESPLAQGSALENFTTLYACPGCGEREAVANEYSVQAHDNMAVFVRCLKCGETWNVEA